MRRATLALVSVLSLAACGGGDDDDSGGPGGGGGGGGTGARLTATGTIPLQATQFTSVAQSTTCSIGPVNVGVGFAVVGASDQPGMCGYLQRQEEKQNAKSIVVALARLNPLGAAAIVPDTYPIVEEVTTQQKYALMAVTQTDLACAETDVVATGGDVVITSVDQGRVRGTVDATLADGGTVTGTIDAPACGVDLLAMGDVCAGELGPAAPACVP